VRILTVRQPWAWAIVHGGKDVENRVRNIAGRYRGAVAIHADHVRDFDWSYRGPAISDAMRERRVRTGERWMDLEQSMTTQQGLILGVVDLVDVHLGGSDACEESSPWADARAWHLVLDNPMPLVDLIPHRGASGLRRLDAQTTARVVDQISGL